MGKLSDAQQRGLRIKELREQAGLHRDNLAQRAQLGSGRVRNGATIKNWEAGGGIVLDSLLKVLDVLAKRLKTAPSGLLRYVVFGWS